MKRLFLPLLLVVAFPAEAARVIVCDPADAAVAHAVKRVRPSAHTDDFTGRLDVLINPSPDDRDFGVGPEHLKCDGGDGTTTEYTQLVEMSQAEKDAVDASREPPPWSWRRFMAGPRADRPACNSGRRLDIYVARRPSNDDQCFVCIQKADASFVWAEFSLVIP